MRQSTSRWKIRTIGNLSCARRVSIFRKLLQCRLAGRSGNECAKKRRKKDGHLKREVSSIVTGEAETDLHHRQSCFIFESPCRRSRHGYLVSPDTARARSMRPLNTPPQAKTKVAKMAGEIPDNSDPPLVNFYRLRIARSAALRT